ncbi:unnamed protein product [Bemisia tabaci]|uniref:Uncharacterized protein n=1 Tax=Bemisia tabaci TaxID=7038 RepID=A0A9P0F8I6_BEMTA|nr:unnamed protein product [Bemisia tabaci]
MNINVFQLLLVAAFCEVPMTNSLKKPSLKNKSSKRLSLKSLISNKKFKFLENMSRREIWELPSAMEIEYGTVIEMAKDSSLLIGVHQKGTLAFISKRESGYKYGEVMYVEKGRLNERRYLSRILDLYSDTSDTSLWNKNKAVALISKLAKKKLRVGLFCSAIQWMQYVTTGKPPKYTYGSQCPLHRDLTADETVTAASIGDRSFFLENHSRVFRYRKSRVTKFVVDEFDRL